jgi:hypothetical protein
MRLPHGRRVTRLCATASGQLGSENAQVRCGGLGVLERLAQDNPAHRQAVVDVICAYLRRPFPAVAPASMPDPKNVKIRKEPGAEDKMESDGTDDTWRKERGKWRQERRVRLTAQRILTEHLRDDRARGQPSADLPGSRFWEHIRLDLAGATLIDFSLVYGVLADADFHRAAFAGDARFGGAAFTGNARFGGAAFTGNASFSEAAFGGDAWFRQAAFGGRAWFDRATFSRGARFDTAAFAGDAWFSGAAFTGDAGFDRVAFGGDAAFGEAAFARDACFGEVIFGGDAWFDQATFNHDVSFGEAAFARDAWFTESAVIGGAWFGEATFSGGAGALHFDQARILSPGASHLWPTGWHLTVAGSTGYTVIRSDGDGGS